MYDMIILTLMLFRELWNPARGVIWRSPLAQHDNAPSRRQRPVFLLYISFFG